MLGQRCRWWSDIFRKHDTLNKCCYNGGPALQTVDQHCISIVWCLGLAKTAALFTGLHWAWVLVVLDLSQGLLYPAIWTASTPPPSPQPPPPPLSEKPDPGHHQPIVTRYTPVVHPSKHGKNPEISVAKYQKMKWNEWSLTPPSCTYI